MSNIATTLEQSKKLIKAGLNPETADMVYQSFFYESIKDKKFYIIEVRNIVEDFKDDEIPAWSLSKLIDICNDSIWSGSTDFTIGDCSSNDIFEYYINFLISMLNDTGEDDDTGSIIEWQEKYKINDYE